MGTATFIKKIELRPNADQSLYQLDPPITTERWNPDTDEDETLVYDYVVVSATVVPFSGPETYLFGANEDGDILNWGELGGSFRGGLDHAEALDNAGYTIAKEG